MDYKDMNAIGIVRLMLTDGVITEEQAIKYFPELKEIDDIKMKNFISNELACLRATDEKGTVRYKELTEAITWVEKQGESALEAANEEKVDNQNYVKSKFKDGDWVMWDNKISWHINNVYQGKNSLMYTITDTNNMTCSCSVKGFDNNAHLWTIQDAKDGDIISYDNEWTCIFKHIHGIWYSSYCFITADEEFHAGYEQHAVDAKLNGNAHPATKEQRALLFQKMKEAGYEWDAEKKEFKKIEQKSAWSEEDEEIHRKCICAMRASACGFPEEEKFVEQVDKWLKSLRDKYTWKPSDEQMKILQYLCETSSHPNEKVIPTLESLYQDLKKLREK